MQFVWISSTIALVACYNTTNSLDYRKWIKIDCNSTGPICVKTFCDVRSVSRYQSYINFGCEEFNGPMLPMTYSITIEMKPDTARNFRKIFEFLNINACDLLNHPDNYPFLKPGIHNFEVLFPGIIQKCPYKVLKVFNGTIGPPSAAHNNMGHEFRIFPNGLYRTTLKLADDKENPANMIQVTMTAEVHYRYKNFITLM